ncbi:MAG: hypothetical protein V3V71_01610 [Roseateles sp.]|jgi:hypothetical protein|uniref:Uncharacterized protein n=2 Tax=cellular organisms TaxID=131567 RepID=A0A7S1EDA1_HEMAN|nr:hypothetical protein [Methylibium sp.]MBY0364801.1 hypothetical protein [Burkholderiaceae bacterium]RTL17926.1 MAG: hypothetical protein EKK52_15540 [Burkholderiales bacterium]|mmetsp:Transcript_15036/g.35540  ORF Transcript_15036/g.35540 Transcript_15036/m.35540 type:complete len:153 (+) Transcript_15036:1151-1609(+)
MERGDYWDGFDEGVDAAIIRRPHARAIETVARQVQRWFPRANIHLEDRRRVHGQPGALLRWPDIQFVNPERRRATHIEVDTTSAGMDAHIQDHLAHSRNRRGVFLRVDPRTGAILRKIVYAAGAQAPMLDLSGTRAAPLTLARSDVFDAFDD